MKTQTIRKHANDRLFTVRFQTKSQGRKERLSPTFTQKVLGSDRQSVQRAFLFGRDPGKIVIHSIA